MNKFNENREGSHHEGNNCTSTQSLQASQGSAFSPYRPSTVLTNLQRGNIQTPLAGEPRVREVHELSALGELFSSIVNLDETNVNKVDEYGLTPVLWAASYGQLESLNKLKDHGANLNLKGPTSETALMLAAANGHSHVVKVLIAQGNIDDVDEEGNSALMYAAYGGHKVCVKELLNHGADVTLENSNCETAYDIATKMKRTEVQTMIERHTLKLLG